MCTMLQDNSDLGFSVIMEETMYVDINGTRGMMARDMFEDDD
jgi:hypothetical protein